MQTQRQRGRTVPASTLSPLPIFYGLLLLIALLGGTLLFTQRPSAPPAPIQPSSALVRPLHAPSGTTPEGFAYKGDPNAPVKVIEYADFECPACGYFFQTLEPALDQRYIETGKVQLIFHDFPLPQHGNAIPTAAAARCAGAQNSFWPMHDLLFSRQREWQRDRSIQPRLAGYAAELGLDSAAFAQCMADPGTSGALEAAATESMRRGISGTPSFEVNGRIVDATELETAIQAELRAGGR